MSLKDKVFKDNLQTRSKNFEDILKKEFGENTVMANLKRPKYGSRIEIRLLLKVI